MKPFLTTLLSIILTLFFGVSLIFAQTGMEGSPETNSPKPAEAQDIKVDEQRTFTCLKANIKLDPNSDEAKLIRDAIAKESDEKLKKAMQDCYDLRVKLNENTGDSQGLQNTDLTPPDGVAVDENPPTDVPTDTSNLPASQTGSPSSGLIDPSASEDPTSPDYKPGAPASAYSCTENCGQTIGTTYENSGVSAPVSNDFADRCVVTSCDRAAWEQAGMLEQKRLIERGADKYLHGIDTSGYQFNQISPEQAKEFGTVDPAYRTPAFAKMMDNHIAPDLWKNSTLEQRQLMATNYLTDVTGRYTPNQAAGIVGNFTAESNMNPLLDARGSENSSGLAQWNAASAAGYRRQALEAYAGQKFSGYHISGNQELFTSGPGGTTQLAFADAEMQGYTSNPNAGAIRAGRAFAADSNMSVSTATQIFGQHFEAPADLSATIARRQSAAVTALNNFAAANGGAISGGGLPPARSLTAESSLGRITTGALNTSLSPQGVGTPISTLGNIGAGTGDIFGGSRSSQSGANRNPISNAIGQLLGISPTQSPTSAQYSPTAVSNANSSLNSLLRRQSSELQQITSYNQNSNQTLSQTKALMQQHQTQLRQFAAQHPAADQNYLRSVDNMLTQQISQINQLEQQQQNVSQSTYAQELQRLMALQRDQQQSVINSQGQTVTNARPAALNTSVQSDLTVTALRANSTLSDEYRFRGSLSRTLRNSSDHLAFDEVGSYFGSDVVHELLLDLECDGKVDDSVKFETPYYSILPRSDGADVLLSEYLDVTEEGLHCFAFKVDVNNDIPETDENNNTSSWREFIVGFGSNAASSTTTVLPSLKFEVSAHTAGYASLTQNWTSEDVVIGSGQELAFRWDAPQYQQCIPLLSSLTPDFVKNTSPVERNTLSENVDLHEHTGYYELRCSIAGDTKVETIHVTVE